LSDIDAIPDPAIPWIRRMMGDQAIHALVWFQASQDERKEFEAAFPETTIYGW